jgi:transposase
MSKKPVDKKRYHDEAFKLEALRMLATSGRKIEEVAANLGIARSTLGKWKTHYTQVDLLSGPHDDVQKELARLRRENELLRAERDLLKKATAFFAKETSR